MSEKAPMAFILISSERGKDQDLVRELKTIQNVKEVFFVYGIYDIVVKVQAETMEKLKDTITWKIRRLGDVRSTLTMVVME